MPKKVKVEAPVEEKKEAPVAAPDLFDNDGELVVDVFETDASFVVSAAIAGVQIKDIDISLEKDMMVIKGNREDPHTAHPDRKYFYQECYWGPFSRKVVLPELLDIDNADAQIDKGILTVKIPKNQADEGKGRVGVKTA